MKKIIITLLVFVLAVCLLASCTSKKDPEDTTGAVVSDTQTDSASGDSVTTGDSAALSEDVTLPESADDTADAASAGAESSGDPENTGNSADSGKTTSADADTTADTFELNTDYLDLPVDIESNMGEWMP